MQCIVLTALLCSSSLFGMEQDQKKSNPFKDLIVQIGIGSATGVTEVTANQPLVRLKNLFQLSNKNSFGSLFVNSKSTIFKELYRGYTTNAGSMAPITAIQIAGNHLISNHLSEEGKKELVAYEKMAAAFAGGVFSAFASSPAELVMLHQQETKGNFINVLQAISSEHGSGKLFRGFFPIAVRDGMFSLGYQVLGNVIMQELHLEDKNQLTKVLAGGVPAGIVTALVTHPFDTMSTLMKSDLACVKYPNAWVTFTAILQEQGVQGLYKGLVPRTARVSLAIPLMSFVSQFLNEQSKSYFDKK